MKYPKELFDEGACMGCGTDAFYTASGETVEYRMAKKICSTCPVMDVCLEWALHHETHGLWAGTSPKDRERMRRNRGIRCSDPVQEVA